METKREPLSVKNSSIPKPSRLLPPGTVSSLTANRKRPAQRGVDNVDKENGPVVKRAKIDTSNSSDTITTTTNNSNAKITASSGTTNVVKKSTTATNGVSAATTKPKGRSTAIAAKRPTRSATTSAASKTTVTTKSKATASGTVTAKKTTISSKTSGKSVIKGGAANGAGGSGVVGKGGGKQKRSPWDLKGRLQDMEVMMADERKFSSHTICDLQSQLVGLAERLNELEGVRQQQEGTIIAKQQENTVASSQIRSLESELTSVQHQLRESTMKYEHELEMLRLSKSSLQRSVDQLESDLKVSRMEVASLKEVVARMTADASAIQCQLDATKVARDQAQEESAGKSKVIDRLESEVASHLKTISDCQQRIREDEMVRRRLHNTIQELKGNIRVFCRVRPFLPNEFDDCRRMSICSNTTRGSGGTKSSKVTTSPSQLQICYPDQLCDQKKITLQYSSEQSSSTMKSYEFDFDRVFGPESSQESVFEEISQLVQSVLDGYNVCIFAYGQTGSGKTFTMEGPEDQPLGTMPQEGTSVDRRGMISRAVEQVFSSAIESKETGWEYKMSASFLEIYNETLRDLLSSSSSSGSSSTSHEIKMDPDRPGQVYVTNLTPVPVTSEKQVESLLERASKNRAVAATNCNERSSRSHSVFMLKVSGNNEKTGQKCEGTLNLIDLAGSERLSQSGSQGERLRETKNINKSLSNLGNVIMALANKDSHVPYRNSKLTYLLQNSLGGNSKTLMFVNMSPLPESFQESLCSLRFATKVNQCNIGTAKKTVK